MAIFGVGCGTAAPHNSVERLCRAVYTPPAPLQQNAIKDGPGGGRGTNWTGNRTVTHCRVLVLGFFPLLEGGNAVRFFLFVFSGSGPVSFAVFCRFSRLRVVFFEKIFGSELLFSGVGVGRVFFVAVLPMFLLYYLVFRSRKCLVKILFWSGPLFEEIFGSELLFLSVGVGRVFFGAVLPMLLLYYSFFRSRKCVRKILSMSGLVFLGFFSPLLVFLSTSSFFLCFFFRETDQVVTGHTPTRTLCFFSFSCLCPRRFLLFSPFWPCVLSFLLFVGVPFWAPGVFWILSGLL